MNEYLDTRENVGAAKGRAAERAWVSRVEEDTAQRADDLGKIVPSNRNNENTMVSNIDVKAEARAVAQAEIDGLDAQVEQIKEELARVRAERAMITAELRPLTVMINDAEAGNDASQTDRMVTKQKELMVAFASKQDMITKGEARLAVVESDRKIKQAQFDTVYPTTLN